MSAGDRTALVVVDMQNLFVAGNEHVLGPANEYIDAADVVVYTRDIGPTDQAGPGDMRLHPDLHVRGTVVPKGPGRAGGFSGFVLGGDGPGDGALGPLIGELRASGATRVDVIGIAADVCVAATARDAVRLGYPTRVLLDATAFVGAVPRERALAELAESGVTVVKTTKSPHVQGFR
jgi:nicotinamidase/pyrazinamidase